MGEYASRTGEYDLGENSNIKQFIEQYQLDLSTPLLVQNHSEPITCTSDPDIIADRSQALNVYLQLYKRDPPKELHTYSWGRTVLSETVYVTNLQVVLGDLLAQENLGLAYSPTTVDASHYTFELGYQKGADCLITRPVPTGPEVAAICGIDVTIADKRGVKNKTRRPGFQSKSDTPVIVVPLRDLTYTRGSNGTQNFAHYLDYEARESILRTGEYEAFAGLSDAEKQNWHIQLLGKLKAGADMCRSSITSCQDPIVTDNPRLDIIMKRLEYVDLLVDNRLQLLETTTPGSFTTT